MRSTLICIFIAFIVIGLIPIITLFLQFLMVGLHAFRNHYSQCKPYTPNVAIIVPAHNEEGVIGATIDSLVRMDYPPQHLRIYVIDDASSDATAMVINQRAREHREQVLYVPCFDKEGFGKAAVLNHGLKIILAGDWAEAVMIIDADVLFEKDTLRLMTRHLADPEVGAVTAYITEGQNPGNLMSHFVGFEYIIAQAASRRAQNVLGVLACLAGGAQLHKRASIEALGGRIDTTTLAEDTFTTLQTQSNHFRVVFDGHAIAISEEPDSISDLWKQRFRWSRGNIQISRAFRHRWFHMGDPSGIGNLFFGLIWFSTLLMPIAMILTAVALDGLFFLEYDLSWQFFRTFSMLSLVAYLFVTLFAFLIDLRTARRVWFCGFMFPGLLSIINMLIAVAPMAFAEFMTRHFNIDPWQLNHSYLLLWVNSWVALCMPAAWLVYRLDRAGVSQRITNPLLLIVGYGPLLCVITFAAYIAELMKREMKWNKTNKTGKVKQRIRFDSKPYEFEQRLKTNMRQEKRLFYYELALIAVLIFALYQRAYWGLS